MTEMERQIQFGARRCQNYALCEKKLQIKVANCRITAHSPIAPLGLGVGVGEGDRCMQPLTFLFRVYYSTIFILSVFSYNAYFWQHRALNSGFPLTTRAPLIQSWNMRYLRWSWDKFPQQNLGSTLEQGVTQLGFLL